MDGSKGCACTGIRSCLLCNEGGDESVNNDITFWYCSECWKIFRGDIRKALDFDDVSMCHFHDGHAICDSFDLNGVEVYRDFVSKGEEAILVDRINEQEWRPSQSGRRKQDFGPKVNFKRKKVKVGNFAGLPSYSKFIIDRMKGMKSLQNFHVVELCNLEYMSERGSSIDPHIDDTWLWGEQLVTLNLLSRTILTLKHRLDASFPAELAASNAVNVNVDNGENDAWIDVQIPLCRRSLLILQNDARYLWTHSIKREHISEKRIAMTFRNLSDEFGEGGEQYNVGRTLIDLGNTFTVLGIS